MIKIKTFVVAILITVLTICQISAEDIGFVTIKNKYQVEVVKNILTNAYTKVGEKFLTSISSEQAQYLSKAGIEHEILLTDVNLETTYLIRSDARSDFNPVDLNKMGNMIDIGMGMKLSSLSRTGALSLSENSSFLVTSLSEKNIQFHYLPKVVPTNLAGINDFPTDTLVARVSQDSIYAFDTRLEAFQTRYIWTDSIDAARDWIVQKLLSWGYTDVSTPSFWWGGGWHYNVMAVKPGYAEPDKVIVIGGHYDSITYGQEPGPDFFAPGADDNASGTTTTLELARILADVPFRKTIIFMPFSAEEVGLVGSAAAAQNFVNSGTDIEVMYNYDMVGYDPDFLGNISLSSGPNTAYRGVSFDAAIRVTYLSPITTSMGSSSDHYSFHEQGYNIVNNIETDFNYPGWHTNLDLSENMNFPYFTEVVKMAAASMAIVANAAHPTLIEAIIDQGDGQSLEIIWSDCDPAYNYTLFYGTNSGVYTDSIVIPAGPCSYIISGLNAGTTYYFSVVGDVAGGYPAIYGFEGSGVPYLIPRPPEGLSAAPSFQEIILDWNDNGEADLSFYRIYRDDGSGFTLFKDNISSSFYYDTEVVGQVNYLYKITAVDSDLNESDFSSIANAYAATFDAGILLVDEVGTNPPMPSQEGQVDYFNSILAGTSYTLLEVNTAYDPLTRNTAGQYSSIYWFDDDPSVKLIEYSEDSLQWYAGYPTNIFLEGYRTLSFWSTSTINPAHMLYQEFGLTAYNVNDNPDFTGAVGQNGWPSVTINPSNPFGNLSFICKLTLRPNATVIYTYDSFTDDPAYEGQ
ncbi:MAG: M28 family peptidase, partial [Candidatus Zixiibacteriota bacterium]